VRVALAQLNPTVGALDANAARMLDAAHRAAAEGADLIVFPELSICGYPPRDLLHAEGFTEDCVRAAHSLARAAPANLTVVLGTPLPAPTGTRLHNGLIAFRGGVEVARYAKRLLPTYDVFDEDRYFEPGTTPCVLTVAGRRVGLAICEDLWRGEDAGFASRYAGVPDPVADLVSHGAQIIAVPSASPFVVGKGLRHRKILEHHARAHNAWVLSVNQVGGQDDLIFEGHAAAIAPGGRLAAAATGFAEDLLLLDLDHPVPPNLPDPVRTTPEDRKLLDALCLGLRDYVTKCGFSDVVLGLSGGIDSALVAALAARALGPEHVLGVRMPGPFSSRGSLDDADALARALSIRLITIPIGPAFDALGASLDHAFDDLGTRRLGRVMPDLTQENLQSRARGVIIMGVSNRTGALVLTTGNKSEAAVGYCTLYGDMNGGLAVISDVPKTVVYRLARLCNDDWRSLGFSCPPIPQASITKAPSAELAPDQTDQDSLPPYDVLDAIIERRVEHHQSVASIARATGFDESLVRRVCRMIDTTEYKRQQLATGLKVTSIAFGPGRRMPIAKRGPA
jgi:NAD+ synthetase